MFLCVNWYGKVMLQQKNHLCRASYLETFKWITPSPPSPPSSPLPCINSEATLMNFVSGICNKPYGQHSTNRYLMTSAGLECLCQVKNALFQSNTHSEHTQKMICNGFELTLEGHLFIEMSYRRPSTSGLLVKRFEIPQEGRTYNLGLGLPLYM